MTKTSRETGKLLRKVAKLDRRWRKEGKPEGRTANELSFHLGTAYRAGVGAKARRIQARNATR